MSNLLRAGMQRVKRDKWLWGGIFIILAYNIFGCISQYEAVIKYQKEKGLEDVVFMFMLFPAITLAASVSVLVGTEFSDGTIRNKIVTGKKRSAIYLSASILCSIEALITYVISMSVLVLVGIPLFGFFRQPPSEIGYELLLGMLLCLVYASLYNMIAMVNQNKAYTAIICIILGFLLLFASSYLYQSLDSPQFYEYADVIDGQAKIVTQENPYYVTGLRREIYQFLMDALPSGATMQMLTGTASHLVRLVVNAVCNIIIFNGIGMYLFKRRDIK